MDVASRNLAGESFFSAADSARREHRQQPVSDDQLERQLHHLLFRRSTVPRPCRQTHLLER